MDALEALTTRVSVPRLVAPGPSAEQLDWILRAAVRAPDHGRLRPWRFLLLRDEHRERLGALFAEALRHDQPELEEAALQRVREKTLRAPLVMVVAAEVDLGSRIPEQEQIIATGAAVQNMMVAAHAQGLGAMWRTGAMARHPVVKRGLALAEKDTIVGFVYLGTPVEEPPAPPDEAPGHWLRELK